MNAVPVTVRAACRICASTDLDLLIDYGEMPLAGGFVFEEGSNSARSFPLRLFRCRQCTLMQVLDVVEPDLVFRNYSYASSTTQTLREHFARMGPEIVERAGAAGKLVVEFGCNDGVLMRPLIGAGAKALGVDPSDVALRASREQGWPLVHEYFTEEAANRIAFERGRARIITGNNVFAHADDLHTIVRGVLALLSEDGHFVFETHYQGDLIALLQYDTVYHEHLCYYSLRSLVELLRPYGLRIADVRRIPVHSGSIRVTAVRGRAAYPTSPAVARMLEEERGWDWRKFTSEVEVRRAALRRLVLDQKAAGRRVAAYGAAGRVTILLNYCGLGADLIDYVVDASPLRQGRYVPGVGVPIVAPDRFHQDPPDCAILTAWNYEEEIVAKERRFLEQGGVFMIPLPEVRLVTRAFLPVSKTNTGKNACATKVSVIMVTCNRLDHLRECMEMILAQTLSNLELIVADDHSSDGTEEYVRQMARQDRRVRYHKAPVKGGITTALNSAIPIARSNYIQICHDHDGYLPRLTEAMADVLDRHPNVVFVHPGRQGCDHLMNSLPQSRFVCGYPEVSPGSDWLKRMLSRLASPVTGLSMIRRAALEKIGLFNPEFGASSDIDMWMRLCAVGDVGYVNELLLYVRGREPDHPYAGVNWRVFDEVIRIHRKHLRLFYRGPAYLYHRARREWEMDFSLAVSYLNSFRHKRKREIEEGREYLRRNGVLLSRALGWLI